MTTSKYIVLNESKFVCIKGQDNKDFLQAARKYANIITITLDGKSKHLDYITYKNFTGEDPVYQENAKIVSPDYLKALSSWPGYTIY